MNTPLSPEDGKAPLWKRIHWAVWCLFAIGAPLLIIDHWASVLGLLPYLVLLACLLMHIFMHGKHRHGHHHSNHEKKNT
jgi:hypothetical protein